MTLRKFTKWVKRQLEKELGIYNSQESSSVLDANFNAFLDPYKIPFITKTNDHIKHQAQGIYLLLEGRLVFDKGIATWEQDIDSIDKKYLDDPTTAQRIFKRTKGEEICDIVWSYIRIKSLVTGGSRLLERARSDLEKYCL